MRKILALQFVEMRARASPGGVASICRGGDQDSHSINVAARLRGSSGRIVYSLPRQGPRANGISGNLLMLLLGLQRPSVGAVRSGIP